MHRSRSFLLFLIVFSLHPGYARAGQGPARLLTIDEALKIAEARSEAMVAAEASVDRAGGEQIRVRSDLFPQLSASASYDRALASEFEGLFDGGTTVPCPSFVANPAASTAERLAELERAVDCGATGAPAGGFGNLEDLPFGRKNTYRLNLNFSQSLYTGGRISAQTAVANATRQTAEINLTSTRAQLMLDVVSAYYDAALSERLLQIAEATYRQADATYEQTRLTFQAGSQPEFELLRALVTRDNQRPTIIRRRADRDIALLRLRQLLDIPATEPIAVSAALDADTLAAPAPFAAGIELTAQLETPDVTRAPVREAQSAVQLSEAAARLARAQRFPTISVTSSYGEVAYPSGAIPDNFRRNWTVGALAQVPILTGGRLRAEEAIARADVRIAEARLQQARELALLDTQSAIEELRAAVASWEASGGTVQQAQRAYEIAEIRYREGVSTQLELSDARLALVQAQATRAQAARDVQVARARVALLPDLPISTPTTMPAPGMTGPPQPQQAPRAPAAPVTRTGQTQTTRIGGN